MSKTDNNSKRDQLFDLIKNDERYSKFKAMMSSPESNNISNFQLRDNYLILQKNGKWRAYNERGEETYNEKNVSAIDEKIRDEELKEQDSGRQERDEGALSGLDQAQKERAEKTKSLTQQRIADEKRKSELLAKVYLKKQEGGESFQKILKEMADAGQISPQDHASLLSDLLPYDRLGKNQQTLEDSLNGKQKLIDAYGEQQANFEKNERRLIDVLTDPQTGSKSYQDLLGNKKEGKENLSLSDLQILGLQRSHDDASSKTSPLYDKYLEGAERLSGSAPKLQDTMDFFYDKLQPTNYGGLQANRNEISSIAASGYGNGSTALSSAKDKYSRLRTMEDLKGIAGLQQLFENGWEKEVSANNLLPQASKTYYEGIVNPLRENTQAQQQIQNDAERNQYNRNNQKQQSTNAQIAIADETQQMNQSLAQAINQQDSNFSNELKNIETNLLNLQNFYNNIDTLSAEDQLNMVHNENELWKARNAITSLALQQDQQLGQMLQQAQARGDQKGWVDILRKGGPAVAGLLSGIASGIYGGPGTGVMVGSAVWNATNSALNGRDVNQNEISAIRNYFPGGDKYQK